MPPLHRQFQFRFFPQDRQNHVGAFFSPHQVAHLIGIALPNVLPIHADQHIIFLDTCLFRRAVGSHRHDPEAFYLFRGQNGDSHTHIGVGHVFLVGFILAGGNIVAPAVAGGCHHGIRRRVFQDCGICPLNVALFNQRLQLGQFACFPGASDSRQGQRGGQSRYQNIRTDLQDFLFQKITSLQRFPQPRGAVGNIHYSAT